MQKFSDDTAVVECIKDGEEGEFRSLVVDFVKWCRSNHLQTREMVVEFRISRPPLLPVSIEGVDMEIVRIYKDLGLQLGDKTGWSANALTRKAKASCMSYEGWCLSISAGNSNVLPVTASMLFYAVVC